MPAYLRRLSSCYEHGCERPATQLLMNGVNAEVGRYCDRHANAALKRFQREHEGKRD